MNNTGIKPKEIEEIRIFAKKYDIDKVIVVKKICERSITIIFR